MQEKKLFKGGNYMRKYGIEQNSPTSTVKYTSAHRKLIIAPLSIVYQKHCTVFRRAYILSGSNFHEFLYSKIESLRKICEIAEFIPNQLRFHEKKL